VTGPAHPPVSVVGRAMTVLRAFRPGDEELTLAELHCRPLSRVLQDRIDGQANSYQLTCIY
jgi:hypothetical protein